MRKVFFFLLATILLSVFRPVVAQSVITVADTSQTPYWISMMQDPEANFYQVQSAFNKYWENRAITKGCGWKPFKRWESMMKMRVDASGHLPAPDAVQNAFHQYMSKYDNPASLAGNWIGQGPFDIPSAKGYQGLGRINAIAFHPSNPDIIYIGAPAGGLWVTTVGGNNWSTTTDMLPTLGVSAIAIDPSNPSTMYIGTGDRDAGDAPGVGVMKSTDNGSTWFSANTGMGNKIVGDLLIDPADPQIIYAGTNSGLFKTIDGGANWIFKEGGEFKDISFKPGNTNILYGTSAGNFYRSTDAGETWFQIAAGLPGAARGVIGVTPANPELVYFLLAKGDNGFRGLYRSTNSGLSFTEMSNSPNIMDWSCDGSGSGGQAWYDLSLTVDPVDGNIIYAGGVNIWKSTNGGAAWQINGHWYGGCSVPAVHADQHIFIVNPLNNRIYAGNDGGIYWTDNGGTQWHEITTGLAISQAYKIGQSATVDDIVVNGYQDNGSSIFENNTWTAINGGDGMECAIDQMDENYRYATMYYGSVNRIIGNYNQGQIAGNGVNGITEEGDWVTPFIIDANDPNTMFIGYKNVWRSVNIKASSVSSVKWKKISTINTGNLSVLEQSPVNTDILYASSGGSLYICTNAHAEVPSWTSISAQLPSSTAVSSIETSPYEENTVYISQDKKIFKSTDKGLTWTEITGNLPEIHINTIVYYKNSQEGLYIGADAGVYYRDKSMGDWMPFTNGLPANSKITELEIYYDPASPAGDRIKAGTYGRGLWKSDMYFTTPTVDFTADQLIIPSGCTVNFTDLSLGIPSQWQWTFSDGSPASSTEKNPANVSFSAVGQHSVQLTATNSAGSGSLTKTGYIVVSDTIKPIPGFYANPTSYCNVNQIVQFTDTTKFCPYAWNWIFTPNTVVFENGTSAISQHPQVIFTQPGSYSVTLNVANGNGSRMITKTDYISAGGYFTPFIEDFESNSFTSKGWTIENPDNEVTWAITDVEANAPGNKAAWMNFFNYPAPAGRRDRLVSPPLNFTGTNPVFMSFEHAYASRFSSFSDSLVIYISEDCGVSWQRIFAAGEKGQGTFATVPKQTTSFAPSVADDWCGGGWGSPCTVLDLTPWANKQNIQIAFESYNRFGNNLYFDNINISSTTDLKETKSGSGRIQIFPNPTSGYVTLFSSQAIEKLNITLFNAQGSQVYSTQVKAQPQLSETLNLTQLPKGVYFVKISGNSTLVQQKLIIR